MLCKCGCEKEVITKENKYISGHNRRGKEPWNKGKGEYLTKEARQKVVESNKRKRSEQTKKNMSRSKIGHKPTYFFTITKLHEKYSFFSKIEEMRYTPDKEEQKEIQFHCKYRYCNNSKEQDGWFTPTLVQIQERIRQLENPNGNGGSYFYCSEDCKRSCDLFNVHSDPYKKQQIIYTQEEYQIFRKFVLERDNDICQFCGEQATEVHHERPQKLEPFFSLDPDYAWSCCEKCHYKFGHKDKCSTGTLASKIC